MQCVLLLVTSFEMIREALVKFISKEEVVTENLILISIVAFFVNLYSLMITHNIDHCIDNNSSHIHANCSHNHNHNHHNHKKSFELDRDDIKQEL